MTASEDEEVDRRLEAAARALDLGVEGWVRRSWAIDHAMTLLIEAFRYLPQEGSPLKADLLTGLRADGP